MEVLAHRRLERRESEASKDALFDGPERHVPLLVPMPARETEGGVDVCDLLCLHKCA
jgi:hypothetical protein